MNFFSKSDEPRKYKNKLNYTNNILKMIDNPEVQPVNIKNIIKSRKLLKATPKPIVKKMGYISRNSRKRNEERLKQFNKEYPDKIKKINEVILTKVKNLPSNSENIRTIEQNLYNIYKNDNNKRRNLVKILKNKKIQRNIAVVPEYKENTKYNLRVSRLGSGIGKIASKFGKSIGNTAKFYAPSTTEYVSRKTRNTSNYISQKISNYKIDEAAKKFAETTYLDKAARGIGKAALLTDKYTGLAASKAVEYSTKAIGTTARSAVNTISDIGRYTGLNKVTGLNKPSTIYSGTKERVKQLKLDIQILKQKKETILQKHKIANNKNSINNKISKLNSEINEISKNISPDSFLLPNNKQKNISNRENAIVELKEIFKINEQIPIIKAKIKQYIGINYNEYSESYENIMSKNSFSNFNLDDEYNKLLLKKNNIGNMKVYYNLLTNNKKNNTTKKIELNENNFNALFKKDNKLFSKFEKSVPYSEYNFLYGIDKPSKLDEERAVALLYASKILFAFPIEAAIAPYVTLAVIGLLMSRFILAEYRRQKLKIEKNIVFCVKYFPFSGIEHFSSELISTYHKIFYYDIYRKNSNVNEDINNRKLKNEIFYESIIELTEKEEDEFIEKYILFMQYLDSYKNFLIKINEEKEQNLPTQVKKWGMEEMFSEIKASQKNSNSNPKSEELSMSIVNKTTVQPKIVEYNELPQSNMYGGSGISVLTNNRNIDFEGDKYYGKKKLVNKKFTERFDAINKAVFRLNYNIDNKYLLTSGDISIQQLYLELKPIINSRSTFLEGELKPLSKSIPFFTNDYLISLLNKIAKDTSKFKEFRFARICMLDFIKEYIDNFLKLYLLAKYNISLLLKYPNNPSNKNLLLKELFAENLSYTGLGRYTSYITRNPTPIEAKELEEIKYRDMLNYYCILLKYCQSALDHIHKRFKISIIKYDANLYEQYNKHEETVLKNMDARLNTMIKGRSKIFETYNKNLNPYAGNNRVAVRTTSNIIFGQSRVKAQKQSIEQPQNQSKINSDNGFNR